MSSTKRRGDPSSSSSSSSSSAPGGGIRGRVVLDVGGTRISTQMSTLTKEKDSLLATMFLSKGLEQDENGTVFLDRNAVIFSKLLDWLRTDVVPVFEDRHEEQLFLHEVNFFGLDRLRTALMESKQEEGMVSRVVGRLSQVDFLRMYNGPRRDASHFTLQGLDLRELDIQGLDMSDIVFDRCNMQGMELREINFSGARFKQTNLQGANLSGTNLTKANFKSANMFRADLTGADLTSAALPGANLQNAVLKNACLRNSFLSFADVTGADITGADVTNANVSNIKGYRGPEP